MTQSNVLVNTQTVNLTWRAPAGGLKNVAFWYDTLVEILAACICDCKIFLGHCMLSNMPLDVSGESIAQLHCNHLMKT